MKSPAVHAHAPPSEHTPSSPQVRPDGQSLFVAQVTVHDRVLASLQAVATNNERITQQYFVIAPPFGHVAQTRATFENARSPNNMVRRPNATPAFAYTCRHESPRSPRAHRLFNCGNQVVRLDRLCEVALNHFFFAKPTWLISVRRHDDSERLSELL